MNFHRIGDVPMAGPTWVAAAILWIVCGIMCYRNYDRWHVEQYGERSAPVSLIIAIAIWPVMLVAWIVNVLGGPRR